MEQFSDPISLPFSPIALPDEILGSWLARLATHNGLESKATLLRWLGVPKHLRGVSLADIVSPIASVNHIFSALGLDYLDVSSCLSTRPYWESMHAWTKLAGEPSKPQSTDTAFLSTRGGKPISNRQLSQAFFKICPVCLEEDYQVSGTSYFHRSHQLKGTRICYKHGVRLLSNCPACMALLGDTRSLLRISMNCRCGTALTTVRQYVDENDPWWRLATFEHRCLAAGKCELSDPRLVGYLRQQLKAKFPSLGRFGGRRALEDTFGKDGAAWIQRGVRRQIATVRTGPTIFSLTDANVTICSALFVACNIAFDEACLGIVSHEQEIIHQRKPRPGRTILPSTVQEARQQFNEFFLHADSKRWSALLSARPHVFWLLTFEDLTWLKAQMPPRWQTARVAVPSVISDREHLAGVADLATNGRLGQRLRQAAIRALYRDKPWLDAEIESSRKRRKAAIREALICRLQQVRIEHVNRSSRPRKFNRRDAAHGLGTTVRMLITQAKKFDIPCDLIEEDWSTFRRRALEWAVEKSLADGLSLAPTKIRWLAGVHAVVSVAYVTEVINEVLENYQQKAV